MNQVRKIVIAAVCLALCLLLPFLTGNNRELGTLFSLMHLPVLLCGIICGLEYGLLVGFTAPLLRSVMFGMPPMPIVAIPMAFELAAYGLVAGFLYRRLPRRKSVFSKHEVHFVLAKHKCCLNFTEDSVRELTNRMLNNHQ